MKSTLLIAVAIGTVLTLCFGALAKAPDTDLISRVPEPHRPVSSFENTRLETLWIFDANFSNLTGDNAGWTSWDRSGTLGMQNYWHHDTIRLTEPYLGDSTWWCGTRNSCWRQPRGYGNNWMQILERHFTEASGSASSVILDFDQRYAMEKDYDYGYVDVRSSATSDTWRTVLTMNNYGFAGTPGRSVDWTDTPVQAEHGHVTEDISAFTLGLEFDLRFRFESDGAYSSQDQYNNPPSNSCLDGAWQLDNIKILADAVEVFNDDSESGNMGWVHDDVVSSGQTGITFWRGRFGIDFVTGRAFTCDDRPVGSWMYAAVDPFTSTMVDGQYSWLMSPPIDVSGAAKLVGHWDQWVDLPRPANDIFNLELASDDAYECVTDPAGFVDESPGWWYGGPFWGNWYDDWDAFAGNDWLAILWEVQNDEPPVEPHMAGIFCNRQRVGVPSGDAGTTWNYGTWDRFNDWYQEQLTDALLDSAIINVKDDDDIVSVLVVADNGVTQNSYTCRRLDPFGNDWICPPPSTEMVPGSEIHYYFEAMDGVGNTSVYPAGAPDTYIEISILPLNATVSNPGILLVDKHGRRTPSAARDYFHTSEYFYREMLGILGYEWETYDVEVPSGSTDQSDGPDSVAYKYYDTQIWFTDEFDSYTIKKPDQLNLIAWLQQSPEKERNLLITGNDWGREVVEVKADSQGFYSVWMASEYIDNAVGSVTVDSVPGIQEAAGGWTFMNHDDGKAILRGGCPQLHYYDVVDPASGIPGNEVALQYQQTNLNTRGAGVAYTHATLGYQTVNLGFGMEYISDGVVGAGASNYTAEGYFKCGLEDRVNLMGNIMAYFGQSPSGTATGIDEGFKNQLSHAYPNPFNPVTKIAYAVRDAGPVTIEVYNVAGKVVRTLLDTEVDAGATGFVVWDGTNDGGERCASGVYFYRLNAPGFTESRKMIMLK